MPLGFMATALLLSLSRGMEPPPTCDSQSTTSTRALTFFSMAASFSARSRISMGGCVSMRSTGMFRMAFSSDRYS